jgi:hypothetical protein
MKDDRTTDKRDCARGRCLARCPLPAIRDSSSDLRDGG